MSFYRLKRIDISLRDYGEHKGKYFGKIQFENDKEEMFSFNLSPEENQKFLDLISEKVVSTASEMGQLLANSIRPNIQITENK